MGVLGPIALGVGWACFALAVVLHATACRLRLRGTSVVRFVAVAVPLGAVLAWMLTASLQAGESAAWAALLLYGLLCELYLFVFTMAATSVSAALLRRLSTGPTSRELLDSQYASDRMVEQRLHRLRAGGFIRQTDGEYVLTPRGKSTVLLFGALRDFFRHDAPPTPDFYQPTVSIR